MTLAGRIQELERQLAEQRTQVALGAARLAGLEAELGALRSGDVPTEIREAPRTVAILSVLRSAPGTMSPSDIVECLREAGRADELRSVTATLDHLAKKQAVQRPARGRYLAT